MALRLISCSPRSGRARCHRRRRNCFRQLDASIGASGPHDFTVRIRTIRQRHIRVHRIPSRACDDRETPLVSGRDQIDVLLIWVRRQVNFGKSEVYRSADPAADWRVADPNTTQERGFDRASCHRQASSQNRTRHGRFGKDAWLVLRQKQVLTFEPKVPSCPGFPAVLPHPHSLSTP